MSFCCFRSDREIYEERDKTIRQLLIDLKGNEQLFEDMKLDIEQYLESFPPEHLQDKRLLVMKYVDRMSDYDIAADLDCDRSTVSKRIDRIIERINSQ